MALIKCPECGKEVSDKAMTCPNCGCPISARNDSETQSSGIKDFDKIPIFKICIGICAILTLLLPFWRMVFKEFDEVISINGFSIMRSIVGVENKTYQLFATLLFVSALLLIATIIIGAISLKKKTDCKKVILILVLLSTILSLAVSIYMYIRNSDGLVNEVGMGTYHYPILNIALFVVCLIEAKNKKA